MKKKPILSLAVFCLAFGFSQVANAVDALEKVNLYVSVKTLKTSSTGDRSSSTGSEVTAAVGKTITVSGLGRNICKSGKSKLETCESSHSEVKLTPLKVSRENATVAFEIIENGVARKYELVSQIGKKETMTIENEDGKIELSMTPTLP